MSKNWSAYQLNVFSFIENETGNAVIEAVAGSGKSTTIIEGVKRIPFGATSLFLAFNKSIAEELKEKGVNARTFHSLTYGVTLKHKGSCTVEMNKMNVLAKEMLTWEDFQMYGSFCIKLVSAAKGVGIGCLVDDTEENWYGIIDHHDMELDHENALMQTAVSYSRQLLEMSNKSTMVDFDDMLYIPVKDGLKLDKYDFVFVDEVQDLNPIQRAMLKKIMHEKSRLIAVGDPCQPPGTLVQTAIKNGKYSIKSVEQTPIENIKVGDYVTSRNIGQGWQTTRQVTGVSKKQFIGELVVFSTENNQSKYTPSHHCVAKVEKQGFCVYLMRKNKKYRIGMSKLWSSNSGCLPFAKLKAEEADCLWILDTYQTRKEALVYEEKLSTQFGISQSMFTEKSSKNDSFDQKQLDFIWEDVNNESSAAKLLGKFKRNMKYPYFTKEMTNVSIIRSHIVRACNLLKGSMMMDNKKNWVTGNISYEKYAGDVYSLNVEQDHLYFADGLLTHNCQAIYGFRGADNDSLHIVAREFNCKTLPLTISYRCSKQIVSFAHNWVSHIQAATTAPEGQVVHMDTNWTIKAFESTDLVVCRTNKPIVNLAYQLIKNRIPAKILGREIGQGLTSLIKKMNAKGVDSLVEKLGAYREREVQKALVQDKEHKIQTIEDKVDSILVLIDALEETNRSIPALVAIINSLFNTNADAVTLCSIHKSKGLEAKRVWWLNPSQCPSKYAKKPWQQQQERNLCYVAATRAKTDLLLIEEPKKK